MEPSKPPSSSMPGSVSADKPLNTPVTPATVQSPLDVIHSAKQSIDTNIAEIEAISNVARIECAWGELIVKAVLFYLHPFSQITASSTLPRPHPAVA